MGRVVIRAIKAFVDGGGSWNDVDKLKLTAQLGDFGQAYGLVVDPLGYMAETARAADETILLTSEILADALRLTHPDVHPPERQQLASRVTQQLLALQPFVFPAAKPKPVEPYRPPARDGFSRGRAHPLKETSRQRYPCADCASTTPLYYCTACRAEFEKRWRQKRDIDNAQQRKRYARLKDRLAGRKRPAPCAACGKEFRGKRNDARFCSTACRQRAYRQRHA
jgi:hypothetical protein